MPAGGTPQRGARLPASRRSEPDGGHDEEPRSDDRGAIAGAFAPGAGDPSGPAMLGSSFDHEENLREVVGLAASSGFGGPGGDHVSGS